MAETRVPDTRSGKTTERQLWHHHCNASLSLQMVLYMQTDGSEEPQTSPEGFEFKSSSF